MNKLFKSDDFEIHDNIEQKVIEITVKDFLLIKMSYPEIETLISDINQNILDPSYEDVQDEYEGQQSFNRYYLNYLSDLTHVNELRR